MFRTCAECVDRQEGGVRVEQSFCHDVVQPLQVAVAVQGVVEQVEGSDEGPVDHVLVDLRQIHVAQHEIELRHIFVFS